MKEPETVVLIFAATNAVHDDRLRNSGRDRRLLESPVVADQQESLERRISVSAFEVRLIIDERREDFARFAVFQCFARHVVYPASSIGRRFLASFQ